MNGKGKKKRKERKGEGEEISGTWMLEQKIQRVCKWETPRWFSIGNLILALTIPINGEYYPFRFRITKLPTIRFVFVHRLVIKVYTRGGVQFQEQSSDLTWLVEEAGEYYIHYFFFLFSLSLSRSLSRSLARCSACLPTTFTRSYTSLAFPRQNQTPPKHERSLVTIPFTTTEDGAQENNSSFFPARDLCLIVVLCTVVQSGEKFVNNNK